MWSADGQPPFEDLGWSIFGTGVRWISTDAGDIAAAGFDLTVGAFVELHEADGTTTRHVFPEYETAEGLVFTDAWLVVPVRPTAPWIHD